MPKSFVITGATSFIGARLVRQLLSEGHQVYAVCRNRGKAGSLWEENIHLQIIEASMEEYKYLEEKISSADVFIHLAWDGTSHQGRDISGIQQSNVVYFTDAMNTAAHLGCQLFVTSGSQAEYGTQLDIISEKTPCQPFSEYGKAKLDVCRKGYTLSKALGMKYIHLRIFSIYGEGDHPWTLVMSCISHMLKNEPVPLSSCTQQWNYLYVGDAARQISLLCQYALDKNDFKQEIFNIASEDTRPLRDFIEEMYKLTKSNSILQYGAVPQQHIVSIHPDVSKLRNAVHFISSTDFNYIIKHIIQLQQAQ